MQHLTIEGKDLLVGDALADALTEYAAVIARTGSGDRVKIKALSPIGESTEVTVIFTSASAIVAETVESELPEPENEDATKYLRERSRSIMDPPSVPPESADEHSWTQEMDQ
jgi:hypothetical protein